MFESSYPLVFLAWFLGGFINGVSGMGAAMVALPIVACVLEMSEAVPATCLVAVTLAVYVAWMYRAHSRVAPIIPMLLGCIPGLIIGVCVLRVAALIIYVAWQLLHRAGTAHPESVRGCAVSGFASGFANAAISFSGPPVAIYALYVGWDKDTTRGTLSLYFLGISICTCIVQAAAGLYTPVVVKAALWGMPGALVGLLVSLPVARFVRESVFQGILLVMIAFAGSVCIIRAVESFL